VSAGRLPRRVRGTARFPAFETWMCSSLTSVRDDAHCSFLAVVPLIRMVPIHQALVGA